MTSVAEQTSQTRSPVAPGLSARAGDQLSPMVVLYLLAFILPIAFDVGPLALSLLRLFLLIVTIPLSIRLLMGQYGRIYITDILFFLHVLWTAIALSMTNPNLVIQQIGSLAVEFYGGYLVGRAYIRTDSDFRALIRALVVIVICTIPFAIYESLTTKPILLQIMKSLGVAGSNPQPANIRLGLDRAQVVFEVPLHYGLFCASVFSLMFVGLKQVSGTFWRFIATGLSGLGGFLALSSGGILGIAIQVCLIVWNWVFGRLGKRWWLLLGFISVAYVVVDLLSNRKPYDVFLTYATFSAHTAYWRDLILEWGLANVLGDAQKGVESHFWFGIGMRDWARADFMASVSSVDNFWLLIAMRYGAPAFLLLFAGWAIAIFRILWRPVPENTGLAQLRLAWLFVFAGLSFTLATVHVWTNIYSYVFFLFGAGIWMIHAGSDDQDAADQEMPTPDAGPDRAPGAGAKRDLTFTRFPTTSPRQPVKR